MKITLTFKELVALASFSKKYNDIVCRENASKDSIQDMIKRSMDYCQKFKKESFYNVSMDDKFNIVINVDDEAVSKFVGLGEKYFGLYYPVFKSLMDLSENLTNDVNEIVDQFAVKEPEQPVSVNINASVIHHYTKEAASTEKQTRDDDLNIRESIKSVMDEMYDYTKRRMNQEDQKDVKKDDHPKMKRNASEAKYTCFWLWPRSNDQKRPFLTITYL